MHISRANIQNIQTHAVQVPGVQVFELPEKVLQFGTGVLLRALPCYYIDKANKLGLFNGRVVMVKSTPGAISDYEDQDGLYTHCLRGFEAGTAIEKNVLNAAVSRVLHADNDWEQVLQLATSPQLQIIISNTTEIGIAYVRDDIGARPPVSFPGKLLAVLYRRYEYFKGDYSKGLVIVPTELIPGNADTLKKILLQLADDNRLSDGFRLWLQGANTFCNSLVDRIVPGKLNAAAAAEMEQRTGYTDELIIMSESYGLWAIEAADEKVKEILSFHQGDEGIIITPDITVYRELKLRLLNGSHTFCCGLALLCGFATVKQAMANEVFDSFISSLLMNEMGPSVQHTQLQPGQAAAFAARVLDRFRNPSMEHQWQNITLQYSSKMNLRNAPLIKEYLSKNKSVPACMSLALAAWILFMKCEMGNDGKYYGHANGQLYLVNDEHAPLFESWWKELDVTRLAETALGSRAIWSPGLGDRGALVADVTSNLQALLQLGPMKVLENLFAHTPLESRTV